MAVIYSAKGLGIEVNNLRFQEEWMGVDRMLSKEGDWIDGFEPDPVTLDRWLKWNKSYVQATKVAELFPRANEIARTLHNLIQSHHPSDFPSGISF